MGSISHADYLAMLARTQKSVLNDPGSGVAIEAELHRDILSECRRRGWLAFHGSMAHRTSRTIGEPDFVILCDEGRVLLVEAKSKTGKIRPEQAALHVWAKTLGHKVWVVRSKNEFLEAAKAEQP